MAKSSLPYGALPIMLGYIHFFSAKSIAGMLVGYVSPSNPPNMNIYAKSFKTALWPALARGGSPSKFNNFQDFDAISNS